MKIKNCVRKSNVPIKKQLLRAYGKNKDLAAVKSMIFREMSDLMEEADRLDALLAKAKKAPAEPTPPKPPENIGKVLESDQAADLLVEAAKDTNQMTQFAYGLGFIGLQYDNFGAVIDEAIEKFDAEYEAMKEAKDPGAGMMSQKRSALREAREMHDAIKYDEDNSAALKMDDWLANKTERDTKIFLADAKKALERRENEEKENIVKDGTDEEVEDVRGEGRGGTETEAEGTAESGEIEEIPDIKTLPDIMIPETDEYLVENPKTEESEIVEATGERSAQGMLKEIETKIEGFRKIADCL